MNDLGKLLVVVGLAIAALGAILWSGVGSNWLGRLPGDIHYQSPKGNFSFSFPLITCLLLSVVLSVIFWLLRR